MDIIEKHIECWDKTGLLLGIIDHDLKRNCVCVLVNQIKYNDNSDFPAVFQRLSIPIIRRVFGGLQAKNIVSKLVDKPSNSIVVELETFNVTESQYDGHGGYNLDLEAQRIADYCVTLTKYIDELASKVEQFVFLGIGWNGNKVVIYTD